MSEDWILSGGRPLETPPRSQAQKFPGHCQQNLRQKLTETTVVSKRHHVARRRRSGCTGEDNRKSGDPATVRWKPRVNPWLIAVTVALAAFMEVLDTSIANVALPHIGGSLGASTDEATWVLTSYLVSNAIVLPLGGWISSLMGRRNFFVLCISGFTVASFLCGAAPSLPILLLCRVLQGTFGGGMQPMAQAIMAD